VLLAVPLLWAAPPTGSSDARRYLDPAARILGSLLPGESAEAPPSWTTWIAYPIAAVEKVRELGRPGGALAARPAAATVPWTAVLRGLWAWLLALVLLEAASFAAAAIAAGAGASAASEGKKENAPALRPSLPAWFTPDAATRAGITAAALLAVAPFSAIAIAHLLPAVPAALLLFLLLQAGGPWRRGILAGMLLAWFGYLWPFVLLAVARPAPRSFPGARSPGRGDLGWTAGIALFLALGLMPERLLHPLAAPGRFVAEWRREGGFDGPGGPGWLSLLFLTVALGPLAWAGWPAAAWRNRRVAVRLLVPAGAVVLGLGLPILLGVRRPGAVQWSVAPLLAAWAVGGALSLVSPRRGLAGIGVILALALVVSPVPGRLAWQRGIASGAQSLAAVGAEIGTFVPKGELIVAEADPFAPAGTPSTTAGADSAGATAGYLVLPRDSRTPGRYDDLYWHRWYAGFRWVLLSGACVSENLARADAVGPRSFYRAVEREGRLMREWGRGEAGMRLYRIPDASPWRRPLAESEIGALRPRAERSWFLSRLGSAYLEAGQSPLAEEIFRLATAWDPANAAAWNNLGAAFLRRGDYPAAAKAFDEGMKRAPDSFELLLNYGRACSAQGLYQRGEGYLLRAVNLRPGYAPVHYELARVLLGLGKETAAVAALRRTLALDPSTPRRAEIESVLARLAGGAKHVGGTP
jgi:Flp pilus assembly protein TadD